MFIHGAPYSNLALHCGMKVSKIFFPLVKGLPVNLLHWANRQAKGLFAHPRSNVID